MERETLKIIYFSKNYTPHDFRFLNSLSKTEYEVFYLKLEANRRQTEDRPVPENVRQILWAGGRGEFRWRDVPRLAFDLRRVIREIQPDLIHAGPIQDCAFLVALSGFRRLLTMSWGYDLVMDADKSAWMQWVTRYTLRRSAYFTSDAIVTRDKAIAYGMNPEKTALIPWGVDLDHFRMRNMEDDRPREGLVIFCNRAWESRYGVDVLARAFVRVAQGREDVRLILLGGGSQAAATRKILQSGGVEQYVVFGGQISQSDLPRWYHSADLYVSPSHVDGSSVSLLEALACGMPCLVSDIPGNKEWIEDGLNGWLFRDGDVDDLTEKILYAIKNRGEFKRMGQLARKTAEKRADWRKNFGKLLEVYNVMARRDAE